MKRAGYRIFQLFTALQLCGAASAEGVWIVQGGSSGYHPTIQAAVDAADDGDILVVSAGIHGPFSVDDKSLSIVAAEGADVRIDGTIEVRNLASQRMVLLSGISSVGHSNPVSEARQPALRLIHNAGHVRIQGSTHVGASGDELGAGAGEGALVIDCARVALTRCTLLGGRGEDVEFEGGNGGDGATVLGSVLALYDSRCTGGRGGDTLFNGVSNVGGRGGDGCRTTLGLFASGSAFTGGRGGDAFDAGVLDGGDGGHGLVVDGLASAELLGVVTQGGPAGNGDHQNGTPGFGVTGSGTIQQYPGSPKKLGAPSLTSDESPWSLALTGDPGDQFVLRGSFTPEFTRVAGVIGVQLLAPSFFLSRSAGIVLPPPGTLALSIPPRDLRTPSVGLLVLVQGWAEGPQGTRTLTSPLHKLFLDRRGHPDCNGNGILDYYDVLERTSVDLDRNLRPDECDPDCDGNGLPDGYDIEVDPGLDVDRNGIIDDCEPVETHIVDASAAPGGDGSPGSPFRTIREGVEASIDGDTVLVRDGLYIGERNKNVDLGSRAIVIRSENGPSSCILDLLGSGRGFLAIEPADGITRIEGFTIRNGEVGSPVLPPEYGGAIWIQRPGAVISNCVFTDNYASFAGGAVACEEGLVERCRFIANRTELLNAGHGGALHVTSRRPGNSAGFVLRECAFRRNGSQIGGALFQDGGLPMTVSHCVFEGNSASYSGGGLFMDGIWTMEGCLLAGNSAGNLGGGVDANASRLGSSSVTDTTFTSNFAAEKGGAIAVHSSTSLEIRNCVLWADGAIFGAELALIFGSISASPSATVTVAFCDFAGGQAGVAIGTGALNWGAGNLDLDPLFFDADGADDDPLTLTDNDYRLGSGSPCVDAADNSAVPADLADIDGDGDVVEPVPWDLLRRPRFRNDTSVADTGNGPRPIVDMGAYERPSATAP